MRSFKIPRIYLIDLNISDIRFSTVSDNENLIYKDINLIKHSLNDIKSLLDNIYLSDYKNANCLMKKFDPFINEKYNIARNINTINITNAWLKCYELIDYFNLIPTDDNFVYFDNASFPGSFIIAINHYVKTKRNFKKFNWYGSSINCNKKLGDDFHLKKNYPNNWLMDKNNNGDITILSNIIDFQNKLTDKSTGIRLLKLYSCDLGFDCGSDYNNQESLGFKLNICQIICGLLTLGTNGHMFIKHFTLFEPFTISYLSLLTILFKEVYISKPNTSRRTNSEVYIVAKFYRYPFSKKSIESKIIDLFVSYIKSDVYDSSNTFIDSKVILPQILSITNICTNIFKPQKTILEKFINIYERTLIYTNNNLYHIYKENIDICKNLNSIKMYKINSKYNLLMKLIYY
jgi:hypothetical protein